MHRDNQFRVVALTARILGKGKGKEVVEDSDIEELDGPPSSKPSGSGSG